jgi:DNA-binding CsgD family transcriptional regulator
MPGQRQALLGYSGLLLILLTLVLLFNLAYVLRFVDTAIYFASGAVLVMLINLIPVLGSSWFLKRFFIVQDLANKEIQVDLSQLYKDFNITDREQEVIKLICEGKTNQEIADTLFITIQTVKDHVYRIFKKVGIKNRVQLTNIFSEYQGPSQ